MSPKDKVKALVFDVFGTVVDWRGSLVRELTAFGSARGLKHDWSRFADDWRGLGPTALVADPGAVPLKEGIRHCVVIGTVPSNRDGLMARWIGDLLVRPADARLAEGRGSVDPRDVRVVGGARHLDLLNHPAVFVHLAEWLAYAARTSPGADPASPASSGADSTSLAADPASPTAPPPSP